MVFFSQTNLESNSTLMQAKLLSPTVHTYLKMAVCWDAAPYSLVEIYRRFSGSHCLHHQCRSISASVTYQKTAIFIRRRKGKVIPLHAIEVHGGRGDIAPTHS
jgi:hypothetical protein